MIPLYEKKCIQIEITNYCNMGCVNCSRFVGHIKNPYYMSLNSVEQALKSLIGFEGIIGCMGGEPTLHPQFPEVCELFSEYIPKEKRGLWTNGFNWNKYENIIRQTFPINNIVYNAHDYEYKGQHQPLLIASKDIIKDKDLRKELIDKCWVQERWSSSINPNGAFFCEIAGAMDLLFNLKGGWKIENNWWKKEVKDFQDQIEIYCNRCSISIPFSLDIYKSKKEYTSISNLELLNNDFVLYDKKYTREDYNENVKYWEPGYFRDFYQHEPGVRIYKP